MFMKWPVRGILMAMIVVAPIHAEDGKNISESELITRITNATAGDSSALPTIRRLATGSTIFREALTGQVFVTGTSSFESTSNSLRLTMHFETPTYPGELISLEDSKVKVSVIQNANRSPLGNLLTLHPELLTEGLFGGNISARWPFAGDSSKIKLKIEGIKKWNDRTVLSVRYSPHGSGKNGELQIHIYLDPETYRELGVLYRLRTQNSSGSMKSNDEERTEFLEERFSDFREEDKLVLPHHWEIRYNIDSDSARVFSWDTNFPSVQSFSKGDANLRP